MEICVILNSNNNSACNVFPSGMLVHIDLDKLIPYQPNVYLSDFNYSSTTKICVPCLDAMCTEEQFWTSQAGIVTLESYSDYTTIAAGLVERVQANESNCFENTD